MLGRAEPKPRPTAAARVCASGTSRLPLFRRGNDQTSKSGKRLPGALLEKLSRVIAQAGQGGVQFPWSRRDNLEIKK